MSKLGLHLFIASAAAISDPTIGPVYIVVAGVKLPLAALTLALIGLGLARYIAPQSSRKLSRGQERALTILLAILLVIIVVGEFPFIGDGEPLGVGMATVWGVGLGTSGLLFIEIIGTRVTAMFRAAAGLPPKDPHPPEG